MREALYISIVLFGVTRVGSATEIDKSKKQRENPD
jgi:hypothetical protein